MKDKNLKQLKKLEKIEKGLEIKKQPAKSQLDIFGLYSREDIIKEAIKKPF